MYSLNGGCWRIFGRLTHGWIFTIMTASKALIGLKIFQEWVMYGTILTVLIISYPYPIWPRSLGSTMISGTAMPLRCIIKLAPLDPLWTPPRGLLYMDIKNYHVEATLVTTVADKNLITPLQTILVINVSEVSKAILVDLAWQNLSKLLRII